MFDLNLVKGVFLYLVCLRADGLYKNRASLSIDQKLFFGRSMFTIVTGLLPNTESDLH
jgi:hypothetical protein